MLQPMGSQRAGHDLATEQQNGKTMDLVDIKLENIDSGFVENMGEDVISISDFNQCLKMNIKAHTSSHLSAPVQVESSCPPGGRGDTHPSSMWLSTQGWQARPSYTGYPPLSRVEGLDVDHEYGATLHVPLTPLLQCGAPEGEDTGLSTCHYTTFRQPLGRYQAEGKVQWSASF